MDDKIAFYAFDLRNINRLLKTKTKTHAMPNGQYWVFNVSRQRIFPRNVKLRMYLVLLFKFSRHLCKGLYQLSRSFCLSHPWGLTFLLSLYHVSINHVSCIMSINRCIMCQHFMKSGKCVKFLTGLAKNDVYVRMGSNDGAKKNLFSKIP